MNKLFGYPGGKWPIRKQIVGSFPTGVEEMTYVDVFGGSAALIITKELSKGEVYNDKNEELTNFFRVVKHRPAELAERSRYWIHSRSFWHELRKAGRSPDEIERAFVFWVSLADSFGGRGMNFGTTRQGIRSVTRARMYLDGVAHRFTNVHVENLDFRQIFKMYDSPDAFFYCDHPYPDTKGGNSNYDLLSDLDWNELRDILIGIRGKVLLSANDHKFIRQLFKGASFRIKPIEVRVTLARQNNPAKRKELLISNYDLPRINRRLRS